MSNPDVTSDTLTSSAKRVRKSYKEPDEDEFDEDEEEEDDAAAVTKQENGNEEEEEGEDEDMDEDEFVVEKIFSHYIADDVCLPASPRPALARSELWDASKTDAGCRENLVSK